MRNRLHIKLLVCLTLTMLISLLFASAAEAASTSMLYTEGVFSQQEADNDMNFTLRMASFSKHGGSYHVVFHANGGEGEMPTAQMDSTRKSELPKNTFTRYGYEFAGWNTEPHGSGTAYADCEKINMPMGAELVLYAQWRLVSMVISPPEAVTKDGMPACKAVITCLYDANVTAFASRYNEFGRFINAESIVLTPGDNEFVVLYNGATLIRFFVLDNSTWAPVCAAAEFAKDRSA